jgi:hypothetical protein
MHTRDKSGTHAVVLTRYRDFGGLSAPLGAVQGARE